MRYSLKDLGTSYTSFLGLFTSYIVIKQGLYQSFLEYTNYTDVFYSDLAIELPKNTIINKQTYELMETSQSSYGIIHS